MGEGAVAQVYCSEPVLPFCVNRSGVYEDELAAQRCGDEIRNYAQGMRRHADCLRKQADASSARAEEIERRHDCMRKGGAECR